jgi:hypothetical protein
MLEIQPDQIDGLPIVVDDQDVRPDGRGLRVP